MKYGEIGTIYSDGEIICREGEKGKCMYVIQSGKVSITKKSPKGEIFLRTLDEGEIFGEIALFAHLPRSATVRADGKTRILSVDKNRFFSGLGEDPSLAFMVIERMCNRIVDLTNKLSALTENRKQPFGSFSDKTTSLICRKILDEVRHTINADNGSVMLIRGQDNILRIEAAFGTEAHKKIELKEGRGIAGNVLKTGEVELVDNITEDTRFIPGQMNVNSLLCAPLKDKTKTFGVINLSKRGVHSFDRHDVKLIKVFSVYASTALENVNLYYEDRNSLGANFNLSC